MITMQPDSLLTVLEASQTRIQTAATSVASAAGVASRGAATAELARESMFAEAMLSAMHARFSESKEVTH